LGDIDTRVGAPEDLAPHVMEFYYAPLSTRVIEREVSRPQRAALADYEEKRAALVRVLRRRLDELASVGMTTRREELAALARQQAPALATLEAEAERLREDLISSGANWYAIRSWKLRRGSLEGPRTETLFLEYQLLRAAAFFQVGLSAPQRWLLREWVIELESHVFPGDEAQDPQAADWFWFFSPHLARVHLPDDLPPDMQEMITAFREEKAALKWEVRNAIYENDELVFESRRVPILQALAEQQAERFAALDEQAETIRERLALVAPAPAPAPPPELPAEMQALIERYQHEKRSLERELADGVRRAIRHLVVPDRYASNPSLNDWREARAAAIADAREHFRARNAARLSAVRALHQEARTAIEAWMAEQGEVTPPGMNSASFLADFFDRRSQQQAHRDYHFAVFEPGLSPAQRRLLFGAAVAGLRLPLPGPEEQPSSLPGTLLK
jgi:hypothetical protein